MKKLINLTWILAILLCTGFTSCSDNDDEPQDINIELLYGSWYYEEYGGYGKWYEVFTFREGGRLEYYWEEYANNGNLIDEGEDYGSWKYENGTLILTYEDLTEEPCIIVSLSRDALVVGDSEGETNTYYRAYE